MKKIAIVGLLSLCAAGAYAQGTVQQYNNFSDLVFNVYPPDTTGVQEQGDTAAEANLVNTQAGFTAIPTTTTYVHQTPIGSSSAPTIGGINYALGQNFSLELYALTAGDTANGGSVASSGVPSPFSSLQPLTQYIATFFAPSANQPGVIAEPSPSPDPGIPNTGYLGTGTGSQKNNNAYVANNATIAEVAWYNMGGTLSTLALAQGAGVPTGQSAPQLVMGLSEPSSVRTAEAGGKVTPGDSFVAEPYYLQSFDLVATPEPSTIALGVIGACAFLARRRKK